MTEAFFKVEHLTKLFPAGFPSCTAQEALVHLQNGMSREELKATNGYLSTELATAADERMIDIAKVGQKLSESKNGPKSTSKLNKDSK